MPAAPARDGLPKPVVLPNGKGCGCYGYICAFPNPVLPWIPLDAENKALFTDEESEPKSPLVPGC